MSIVDSEAETLALCLGVHKFIDHFHSLGQVATYLPHQFKEIILVELLLIVDPESYIFEAGRILGVLLELGDLSCGKLTQESLILTPEQPNIINLKQPHSPPLQSQAERPPTLSLRIAHRPLQYRVMYHPTPKHFQPLIVIEDLQFQ